MIDLTHRAAFSNEYSSVFISNPARSTRPEETFQVVVAPSDAANQYCHDGFMGYVPMIFDNFMRVRAQVSLIDSGNDYADPEIISISPPHIYIPSVYEGISIPRDAQDVLDRQIQQRLGLMWYDFEVHPSCETMIDQLPTIRYSFLDLSDTAVVDVYVEPSDYIAFSETDQRRCRINVVDPSLPAQIFGRPLLRSAGVHIDYSQQRIGFCDPL